jgi:hypothetical protein
LNSTSIRWRRSPRRAVTAGTERGSPSDPRHSDDARVRARASRAARRAPAGRLRPLTPSPSPQRLAVMPFRHGSVCQIGVSFLLCAWSDISNLRRQDADIVPTAWHKMLIWLDALTPVVRLTSKSGRVRLIARAAHVWPHFDPSSPPRRA